MSLITFLILFFNFSFITPEKIVIDVKKTDQLNISEIADKIIAIPLKINNFKNIGIEKVFIINENIFILQRYQENNIHYSHVFRFDLSGNYKGEFTVNDPKSTKLIQIGDMHFNSTTNLLYISCTDGYRVFDLSGNFLSFKDKSLSILQDPYYIFLERFWWVEHSFKDNIQDYTLVSTDLKEQEKEIIGTIKLSCPPEMVMIFPQPSFSVYNNELYVSFNANNIIYKLLQNKLYPQFNFEFINIPESDVDIKFFQKQILLIGPLIKFGYLYKMNPYVFLYNRNEKKSYNIQYRYDHNEVVSGIKDDIYHSGYFDIKATNLEDHIYFVKYPKDLKDSKLYDPKQTAPTIFLVKLK